MATQFDPIAKDESLNTTESPSRNVADVLAQGLDAIEQAIAGGSGSGGHTIVNASGTDMTQRAKMQFVDAEVTDDAVNDVTKISTTPASYQSANVTYGSGSVEDALDDLNGSVKVKILTYSVTTGNANTHYFNNGTANIAKGQVALSSHADYPSTAVGAVAVSARSSSGYSVALPAIEGDTYVVAYGSTNMTVNVSVLVFYT